MKLELKDKYVILSGASGGIGREIAILLVKKYQAKVIGIARNREKLQTLKDELGDNFRYCAFDVSEKSGWEDFARQLSEKDITPALLVNNAGAFPSFVKAIDTPSETVEKIMKTNFFSCVYATESLLPIMKRGERPVIYNICSSSALCSVAGTAAYTASKSAMKGYTESLMTDGNGKLFVGIVFPGTTNTGLFRNDERVAKIGIEKIAMTPQKTAKKCVGRMIKLKKRSVIGWDAHLMSGFYRLCPLLCTKIIAKVMKKFGKTVFADVFDY